MNNHKHNPNAIQHKRQGKDKKIKGINPQFDDLNKAETFNNHFEKLKNENKNVFPVEVFPKQIQDIIKATNENLNFPIDFMGASILYAVSVSIGNTYEAKAVYPQNAVLYLAIVGKPGTNKSHPLKWALKPIVEKDNISYAEFSKELKEYKINSKLSKKELEEKGLTKSEINQPVWQQHLISDFTPEALAYVHLNNKRGLGVDTDELATWFKNFNRYNTGSEEQFWLSSWSGGAIKINRKTSDPINIPKPFISVGGTIQPGVINELANNRTENGFVDRILFVIPNDLKKEYWNENEIDPTHFSNWKQIISNLLVIPMNEDEAGDPKPETLEFEPKAKKLIFEFQRDLADKSNNPKNDDLRGVLAKVEQYAIRFALILEMARFACNESKAEAISFEATQGAIKLANFFTENFIKINSIITDPDPLAKLNRQQFDVYNALPEQFLTHVGVETAKKFGMSKRSFYRFKNKWSLFEKTRQGVYEKKY